MTFLSWTNDFINELIGKPWQLNGTGNPGWDCFTLMKHIFDRAGIATPDWEYHDGNWEAEAQIHVVNQAKAVFERVDKPRRGDFVFVAPAHCGVMLDSSHMISCDKKRGVFQCRVSRLRSDLWFGRYRWDR